MRTLIEQSEHLSPFAQLLLQEEMTEDWRTFAALMY